MGVVGLLTKQYHHLRPISSYLLPLTCKDFCYIGISYAYDAVRVNSSGSLGAVQGGENPRVKQLRLVLIVANATAIAVLLAIPIGKLFGVIEEEVGAAAVYGWLIFFVPLFASALALWGIQFSRPALARPSVIVAMPGSFLVAFLSLFTYWQGPSDFAQFGIGATILFCLNVLALWEPFKDRLE